jgi:TPR repeat protein
MPTQRSRWPLPMTPRYLAEHKLIGIIGDEAKARAWFQRASELGATEADRILQRADIK